MNIQFFEPLSRAWDRMVLILFRPFDLGKWFTIGFTAFLADLMNGPGGSGSGARADQSRWSHHQFGEFFRFPERAWDWLLAHPLWSSLIVAGILILIILTVLFTWLSSRGKFMFLDNVVHNRAEVVMPWKEYRREADSLFLWRLIYGFIVFGLIMTVLVMAFLSFSALYFDDAPRELYFSKGIGIGLLLFLLIIILSYIDLFLTGFVVPVMYKKRVGVMRGWGIFLSLFSRQLGYFIVFGLIMLLMIILAVMAVIVFGLGTCCIGFLLLIIPYLNAVVLLPLSVLFRSYSLEFLKQFGEEYDVFPAETAS